MIISDLDYLETVSETLSENVSGGRRAANAWTQFSALAVGQNTQTSAVTNLFAYSGNQGSYATSSTVVSSAASGNNTVSSATAVSSASVS
ncbi:hypothetical protein F7734_47975 [Scytonema sp. UIC 10036]|uniref:hypothetical protein n=1 Tax=Scytonema sp. UIC 10036 TaxID=2304196 RepID=UPI0012DA1129|nr:hypothetical protein [Scytonema sp. UIC 10036]MUG99612.1 hypothetical protein [Scytonema sp. UIC 10036]